MRIMAAVPTLSGSIDSLAAETLLQLQALVLARGGGFVTRFHSGSVISTIRNLIAADFLGSDADALFMLDSDQGVSSAVLERMLDKEGDAVGCIYPKRSYDWSAVSAAAPRTGMQPLIYQAMSFVGALDAGPGGAIGIDNGFAPAVHVGTGALLVRRSAFDRLERQFPELEGRGFYTAEFPEDRFARNWGFFNPIVQDDGGMLSEDFSFCRRLRGAGGTIWADIIGATAHVGRHVFSGSYYEFLQAVGGVEPPRQ